MTSLSVEVAVRELLKLKNDLRQSAPASNDAGLARALYERLGSTGLESEDAVFDALAKAEELLQKHSRLS